MAERVLVQAAPRTVLGKKVARLRRDGLLPANVYGRGIPSKALELDAREFSRTIKHSGLRAMMELSIDGETTPRYVILRGMTRKGGTGDPTHIDFFQVDPNKPIHANVPLRLVGEAPAVRDLAGVMNTAVDMVAVLCKPLDIPDGIDVDVSGLVSFDVSVTVGDLEAPEGVEILTDPSVVVATVNAPRLRMLEEDEKAAAEAEAEGEADADAEEPESE